MTEEFTQAEKRKVMKDTLFSRAQAEIGEELGGRFKHLAPAPVTGIPQYPRAAASHRDPTGPVAPLGFRVDAIEPVGTPAETERSIAQLAAGSPPFPAADEGPTPGVCLGPSGVGPGRPSTSTERRRA